MFNSRSRSQAAVNRQTYIPPHIEQAMNQHLQASMPAHLKQYVGANSAYVPERAQAEMARYLEKSMPAHLKQYAGAYMQQRVIDPNGARLQPSVPAASPTQQPGMHPPVPNLLRRDHSVPGSQQHWVEPDTLPNATPLFQPDSAAAGQPPANPYEPRPQSPHYVPPHGQQLHGRQPAVASAAPAAILEPAAGQLGTDSQSPAGANPAQPGYDFILNPQKPARRPLTPRGVNSRLIRVAAIGGGLIVLVIIFAVIKNLLSSNNFPQYVSIAQDQQELIHLSTNATTNSDQDNLSVNSQNFAYTVQLSLTSAQTGVLTYLQNNGTKVSDQLLNAKVSAATDRQLTGAAANSIYDQTFQSVMQSKLNTYIRNLEQTYKTTAGPHGKALLSQDYAGARLLLKQLNSPAS